MIRNAFVITSFGVLTSLTFATNYNNKDCGEGTHE
jgi:hypothetical protein